MSIREDAHFLLLLPDRGRFADGSMAQGLPGNEYTALNREALDDR